ncbi:hypothetical protein MVLG_06002 [Microbotryum lychnidis-dioicae p1A1 Lamole]|uniref:Uncharacterized protein n=1 Tax=Microbotryum lychnidis-dioicae (strain p1A1 Lamole / MvSl-1064) TaxID=683840 RepID=U5HFX9_USTV1|nr:hypothetical protein MVLG_06002 [Microbotryum lychnidis-dioicae p1A1 Lamole]|eukprot:KDE03536.1 hypothetical protein MVLG_06002 [Microbotryum lychnidis-dioicae p1A1 Lamole]
MESLRLASPILCVLLFHAYRAKGGIIITSSLTNKVPVGSTGAKRKSDDVPKPRVSSYQDAHNKASQILHRDERLRGMVPLEEHLETHADVTDPTHFLPHRSILLPSHFLKRYHFYARRFSSEDDLTQILRPASEERSKKKRKSGSLGTLLNWSSAHAGAQR